MGATSGAGTTFPSGAHEFTPGFTWGSCYSIFCFICMICRSLFVLLYFFFWPLCCLFFFDMRFLIVRLVSSNSFSSKLFSETLEFLIDNILVMFGWRFSTDSRHTYGYILCSYSHRFIRTMQTAYRGSSRKTIRSHPILQFHITLYRWYTFTK